MNEADNLCDRIAIMDQGKIMAGDTPEELKQIHPIKECEKPALVDVFLELTSKNLAFQEA